MKAIVKNGAIEPQEPLPIEWLEGTMLEIERTSELEAIDPTDAWMDEVEKCASAQDPEDDYRMQQAIDEERRLAKELARQGKG
jgi:hypothetical protein